MASPNNNPYLDPEVIKYTDDWTPEKQDNFLKSYGVKDTSQNMDQNVDENMDENKDENMDQDTDENKDENMDQDIDENKTENIDQDIDENMDQDIDENIDQDIDENENENMDEDVVENNDENMNENSKLPINVGECGAEQLCSLVTYIQMTKPYGVDRKWDAEFILIIIAYIKYNQLDGNTFKNMRRSEFARNVVNFCDNKKIRAAAASMYSKIQELSDISEIFAVMNFVANDVEEAPKLIIPKPSDLPVDEYSNHFAFVCYYSIKFC